MRRHLRDTQWKKLAVPAQFLFVVALALASCGKPSEPGSASLLQDGSDRAGHPEFVMTRELPDITRRLTNHLSTCWLQAGTKELEFAYYRVKGQALAFSAEYLMMSALHDRFLRIVRGEHVRAAELEAGGEMNEVRILIQTHGVVPESSWRQPENAWGDMAKELNPTASSMRKRFLAAQKTGGDTESIIADAETAINDEFAQYSVHVPSHFTVNGVKTTPLELEKTFAFDDPMKFVLYVPQAVYSTKPTKADLDTVQDGFATSWQNIGETIKYQVDHDRSALISIYWSDSHMKYEHGVLTVSAGELPANSEGHVINVTGYRLDSAGKLERIKIENTWGRTDGYEGFLSVSWHDFQKIYQSMSVPDGYRFAETKGFHGEKVLD